MLPARQRRREPLRDLVRPPDRKTAIMIRSRGPGVAKPCHHYARSTLSEGCGVRWRTIWPFKLGVPRGTYFGRRQQPEVPEDTGALG